LFKIVRPLLLTALILILPVTLAAQNINTDPIGFYAAAIRAGRPVDMAELIASLNNRLTLELNSGDFQQALVYGESLNAFNAITASRLNTLYAQFSRHVAETSSPGVALATLGNQVNISLLDNDMLLYFLGLAEQNLAAVTFNLLQSEAQRRGLAHNHRLTVVNNPANWLSGTVVVYVDRGFIRRGGMVVPNVNLGSGFFIDKAGYILTNYHVIAPLVESSGRNTPAARLSVELAGAQGERVPAELIGFSRINDIALLRSSVSSHYVFSFANRRPVTGEQIFALGSPGGLASTLTSGLVSNANRTLMPIGDIIQIDAAVNPGNSGGPLVGSNGEVLGVVFAGIEQFQGVNFALPSDLIVSLLPKLAANRTDAALPFLALALHEWSNMQEVTYVAGNSLAAYNNLKVGDRLAALNGQTQSSRAAYQKYLMSKPIGALIRVNFQSAADGTAGEAITLIERRASNFGRSLMDRSTIEELFPPLTGMNIERISRRDYVVRQVYPATLAGVNRFSSGDSFTLLRQRFVEQNGHEFLVLNIRSLVRAQGLLEGPNGLQFAVPFNSNVWL